MFSTSKPPSSNPTLISMVGPNFQDVSREEVERVKNEFGKFSRFYKGTLDFTGRVSGESGSTIDDHNDQFIFHITGDVIMTNQGPR
jgi:hypothetical protein